MSEIKLFPVESSEQYLFSIIIPTWNNLPLLKLCIESIRKNSTYKHQIIIHVNEGVDGTIDWVKTQGFDFSWSAVNTGICLPVNACRSLVKTSYIVYLNDDMYVCPRWDYYLYEEIKSLKTNLFYLSGTMIEPRKTPNDCCISPADYGTSIQSFDEKRLLEEYDRLSHDDWNGASWPPSIVHVNTWDLVGGYSIEFSPGMYSDPDFSMKLYSAGVRIFKGIGRSRVYHFMSKSTGKVKRNNGRKQFIFKWGLSSRDYYNFYLKIGKTYSGPLEDEVPANLQKKLFSRGTLRKLMLFFK